MIILLFISFALIGSSWHGHSPAELNGYSALPNTPTLWRRPHRKTTDKAFSTPLLSEETSDDETDEDRRCRWELVPSSSPYDAEHLESFSAPKEKLSPKSETVVFLQKLRRLDKELIEIDTEAADMVAKHMEQNSDSFCRSAIVKNSEVWRGVHPDMMECSSFFASDSFHEDSNVDTILRTDSYETVVEKLVTKKLVSVNQRKGVFKNTLLMYSICNNREDIARLLLSLGCDVNTQNSYGTTALGWARMDHKKNASLISLMLALGAK
ncbi:ANK domain containing protein [uncultured Caudovirales phage]|uniref:ANK domain containing protein n=1 Tax=uncultured Caudovirales phage TaxID=2100421 RepID=A0A6J5QVC6_9CAUD|nr:ANK domain containing protein [uncultured Caudovirales phage]CAB4203960.1 ANK domain containing protein [uncultured Caudovirales phage]CAB4215380.1 ANK domain containing protein [uncultured Caudovirales phage]